MVDSSPPSARTGKNRGGAKIAEDRISGAGPRPNNRGLAERATEALQEAPQIRQGGAEEPHNRRAAKDTELGFTAETRDRGGDGKRWR